MNQIKSRCALRTLRYPVFYISLNETCELLLQSQFPIEHYNAQHIT